MDKIKENVDEIFQFVLISVFTPYLELSAYIKLI